MFAGGNKRAEYELMLKMESTQNSKVKITKSPFSSFENIKNTTLTDHGTVYEVEHLKIIEEKLTDIFERVDDIIANQDYEHKKELEYSQKQEEFTNNFVLFTGFLIIFIILSAAWQIISLRTFFVAKNIA